MAQLLKWIPDSLYNYSIAVVAGNYNAYQGELKIFHGEIIFDVYYQLYKEGLLQALNAEFKNLHMFGKLLEVRGKRCLLHNCFQALQDHDFAIADSLADSFEKESGKAASLCTVQQNKLFKLGFSLASFLCDAGWFEPSGRVFRACTDVCFCQKQPNFKFIVECMKRNLRVLTNICKFEVADLFLYTLKTTIEKAKNCDINFASVYAEFSAYFFKKSDYNEPYKWTIAALKELDSSVPPSDMVYILRNASKACVAKKQFKQAEMLIKQALYIAKDQLPQMNLLMADTLIDYGYYLLHMDSFAHSIKVYKKALNIRMKVLGGKNLHVAEAFEDLGYAYYVDEYNSGQFKDAKSYAEKALSIKESLLEGDNLLLCSARKVNALILEEIALDSVQVEIQKSLFYEAEEMHVSALDITRKCLGDMNVQTAKHYGNLGRLYQSMKQFKTSQRHHLKGIEIKEKLLGSDDMEVAIALGHLASLYNYDMGLYEEAESLYQKSIAIGLNHYGESYSGLEFDYRGLLRVYSVLGNWARVAQLHADLHAWKMLRDQAQLDDSSTSPLNINLKAFAPENIYEQFVKLQKVPRSAGSN